MSIKKNKKKQKKSCKLNRVLKQNFKIKKIENSSHRFWPQLVAQIRRQIAVLSLQKNCSNVFQILIFSFNKIIIIIIIKNFNNQISYHFVGIQFIIAVISRKVLYKVIRNNLLIILPAKQLIVILINLSNSHNYYSNNHHNFKKGVLNNRKKKFNIKKN